MPRLPTSPAPIGRLRRMALPDLPHPLWRALVDELTHERSMMRKGRGCTCRDTRVTLSRHRSGTRAAVAVADRSGRAEPPWVRELAVAVQNRRNGCARSCANRSRTEPYPGRA